jgi:hypothetical protein
VALRRLAPTVAATAPEANAPATPAPGALVRGWHIDRRDRLHIDKADTAVYLPSAGVTRATGAGPGRQQAEVQRARMQRANVAL